MITCLGSKLYHSTHPLSSTKHCRPQGIKSLNPWMIFAIKTKIYKNLKGKIEINNLFQLCLFFITIQKGLFNFKSVNILFTHN